MALISPDRYASYLQFLQSPRARLVRFGAMGAVTFVVNVALLALFRRADIPPVPAYALALALAVQFNFATSQIWVWRDRQIESRWLRSVTERWVAFHVCTGASLVVNLVAFSVAQLVMPLLLAVIAGVVASTALKFMSLDRVAFRLKHPVLPQHGNSGS